MMAPKMRRTDTASTACPASASQESFFRIPSTACPASASQEDIQRDASPFLASPCSMHSTGPRVSTGASGMPDADLESREDPEPPIATRPIIGVAQQVKLRNVGLGTSFNKQRELNSLATMRQIRRTAPSM